MTVKIKPLIKQVGTALIVGAVSGLLTKNSVKSFGETAVQPSFAPPSWLFLTVWTLLYIFMGVSAYLAEVNSKPSKERTRAFVFYYAQLFFNFLWSFIFFSMRAYLAAFLWLLIMWVLILLSAVSFYKIKKNGGVSFSAVSCVGGVCGCFKLQYILLEPLNIKWAVIRPIV